MKTYGQIDNTLLQSINSIVNENASLRQQVIAQQKIVNDIKLHDVSKDVAMHIDNWMNTPYDSRLSEIQDLESFSFRLTKYINAQLK